jgi:hypothetical protein
MDLLIIVIRQRQHQPHGLKMGHRSKHFIEVDADALDISLRHHVCLVPHDLISFVAHYPIDSFEANGSMASGEGGELPGLVVFYHFHFFQHSLAPRFLLLCLTE